MFTSCSIWLTKSQQILAVQWVLRYRWVQLCSSRLSICRELGGDDRSVEDKPRIKPLVPSSLLQSHWPAGGTGQAQHQCGESTPASSIRSCKGPGRERTYRGGGGLEPWFNPSECICDFYSSSRMLSYSLSVWRHIVSPLQCSTDGQGQEHGYILKFHLVEWCTCAFACR